MSLATQPSNKPSSVALFRYQIVSSVLTRERQGEPRPIAIKTISSMVHPTTEGQIKKVSRRSIYSWLKAFETQGFDGLLPKKRTKIESSLVIDEELLDFFETQKIEDPRVSIPELIRRAQTLGLIQPGKDINRTTVWRALRRKGVDLGRRKYSKKQDSRRFAFPHRLDMVLCDGKHFRAGVSRLKRVALFFIDDATRKVLHVVVGPSESSQLFLRGVYETLTRYGLMSSLFVDNGSGFIANDSVEVLRKLGVLFIHGTAGYPEGRGKVERFNQTAQEAVLRFLDGNPEVDPQCSALQLRLEHYLNKGYNLNPHESLSGISPTERFQQDVRPLRFHQNHEQLRRFFILYRDRRVSKDNIVTLASTAYQLPPGYAGMMIPLHHHLLDQSLSIIHQGRLLTLDPVDLEANARDKRSKPKQDNPGSLNSILPKSSSQIEFENDLGSIVDADGNFTSPEATTSNLEDSNDLITSSIQSTSDKDKP